MATSDITQIDSESGCRSSSEHRGATNEEEEDLGCIFFTNGSSDSRFHSTIDGDGSYDDFSFACVSEILEDEVLECRKASSVSDPCESVDLDCGEKKETLGILQRDCRICHLSLISSSPGSGVPIELGCLCKNDLAAAHKHCAETWFKIKGNKTCEICNSTSHNVVGPAETEVANMPAGPTTLAASGRVCLNGHRFLNFLLACMVFAFVVSWLFHFNIPS